MVTSTVTYAIAQNSFISPNIALDDIPTTASFVVKSDRAGNYWSVASNGSICSVSTDASIPLQSAIDALRTKEGGDIYISSGTYEMRTLPIRVYGNIEIIGAGIFDGSGGYSRGTRLIQAAEGDLLTFTGSSKEFMFSLKNIGIVGRNGTYSTGSGLKIVADDTNGGEFCDALIDYVFFENFPEYGLYTNQGWGWMIDHTIIEFNNKGGLFVPPNTSSSLKICNSKMITNNGCGATIGSSGAMIENSEFSSWTNDYSTAGLLLQSSGIKVVGCSFLKPTANRCVGITVSTWGNIIMANTFADNLTYNIRLIAGNQTIIGNLIGNSLLDKIKLDNNANQLIQNNMNYP